MSIVQEFREENNMPEVESTQLRKVYEQDGTPFSIVDNNGTWFVVMGKHRVSYLMESEEKCKEYIQEKPWELLNRVICITIEMFNQKSI